MTSRAKHARHGETAGGAGVRSDAAAAKAAVRDVEVHLRRGLYLMVAPRLWRRIGGPPLPDHVRRTKGARSSSSPLQRLRSARRIVRDLPQLMRLGSENGTAEIAIAAFDGGAVLVDPRGGRVYRSYGGGRLDARALEWRRAFTRHVAAPAFEPTDDGRAIVEEFVDGRHLLELSHAERIETLRRLLRAYAELTAAEGRRAGEPFAARLGRAMDDGPPALREAWRDADGDRIGRLDVSWIPSAYEAAAKNLMVRADGSPAPIDLGDLQPEPFFSYPLGIVTAAGDDVARAYLDGELDSEFAALFAAAGCPWEPTAEQRRAVLLARTVHAAICDDESGAEPLAESLARRWRSLAPLLSGSSPAPVPEAGRGSPGR